MLIDSHCHLNFDKFATDRDEVLQRAHAEGVQAIINPSVDLADSRRVVDLATTHKSVFAAIGFHPNDAATFDDSSVAALRNLAEHPKVVAIGEIGLDYYWDKLPRAQQKQVFEAQLKLATELNLPVIIHQREAAEDTMAVLRGWAAGQPEHVGLVLHSFSGTVQMMREAIDLGFHIGISGPVTFKKADELRAVAEAVPLTHLLVETDAPFLTPHPFRGKRNEPARVKLVAEKIAALKSISLTELSRHTTQNTINLFRLNPQMLHSL